MSESASPSVTILKFLVIAMGVTLIGGFLFLVSLIYGAVHKHKEVDCHSAKVRIEAGAHLVQMLPEKGNNILVALENKDKQNSIMVLDSCNGKVVRQFDFVASPVAK